MRFVLDTPSYSWSAAGIVATIVLATSTNLGLATAKCDFADMDFKSNPGFEITYNDNYKVLKNTISGTTYGLYCDNKQPEGVKDIDQWFKVPVQRIGSNIPGISGMLEVLGKRDLLKAFDNPDKLTNICFSNKPEPLTKDTKNLDVIFSSGDNKDGPQLPTAQLSVSDDLNPLQRAEWIKFVAAFVNGEKEASEFFTKVNDAYNCLQGNLGHLKTPPHAYWVQYTDSPNKQYNLIVSGYQQGLLSSAGTKNTTPDAPKDASDQKAFQDAVKDANYVFDQTDLKNSGKGYSEWLADFGYSDPQNQDVSFLSGRDVWRTDGYTSESGQSNFPEFAYVRPDLVLQDIISVVEPTYNEDHKLRWLWKLGGTTENPTVISKDNYDCAKPWISTVSKCSTRTDFTGEKNTDEEDGKPMEDSDDNNSSSSSHGRTGKIVGGVVAGVVLIALIVLGLHYYNKNKRRARINAMSQPQYGGEDIRLQDTRRFS